MSLRFSLFSSFVALSLFIGSTAHAESLVRTTPSRSSLSTIAQCSMSSLCLNSSGDSVKVLQDQLRTLQYYPEPYSTGIFDKTTQSSVKAFQANNRLLADGIAGPKTLALVAKLVSKQPSYSTSPVYNTVTSYEPISTDRYITPEIQSSPIVLPPVTMGESQKPLLESKRDTSCRTGSSPWVTVISPNGGETFTEGQAVTVRWSSCNLSASSNVDIQVVMNTAQNIGSPEPTDSFEFITIIRNTPNDGVQEITLPSSQSFNMMKYGNFFSIRISEHQKARFEDYSNSRFTIKSGRPSSSPITTEPSQNTGTCRADDVEISINSNTPSGIRPLNKFDVLQFTISNESVCDIYLQDMNVGYMTTDTKPYFQEIQVRDKKTDTLLGENDDLSDPSLIVGEQINIGFSGTEGLLIPRRTEKDLVLRLTNFQHPTKPSGLSQNDYLHKYLAFGFQDGKDFDFKWASDQKPFTISLKDGLTWGKAVRIPPASL